MDDITIRKDSPFGGDTVIINDDTPNSGEGAEKTVKDERTAEPKEMGPNKETPPPRKRRRKTSARTTPTTSSVDAKKEEKK